MSSHAHESWLEEKRSAWLYRIVSDCESGTPRQVLFLELAHSADEQADLWAVEIRKTGMDVPAGYMPDARTRAVGWLTRRFGPRAMRSVLAAMKVRGMSLYFAGRLLHAMPTSLDKLTERHHQTAGAGQNLRAAVFGINDGLVSNAALIYGVAGANPDAGVIVLAGVAGLLAGAFSMAAGEWVSVKSQREMYEYQIALERDELDQYPQEEAAELRLIFEAKGMTRADAEKLAQSLIADPDRALDTLAREELGLNPSELGSPAAAALSSFFSFSAGASIPLAPFLFASGGVALGVSAALTALALFAVGGMISLFTGRHALFGGARMLAIGGAAGLATWAIGRALGVGLG
jgi:VIT1/CCC1 family predicted Fe2+/Mn2+ transporter